MEKVKKPPILRVGEIVEVLFKTVSGIEYTKKYRVVHEMSGIVSLKRVYGKRTIGRGGSRGVKRR